VSLDGTNASRLQDGSQFLASIYFRQRQLLYSYPTSHARPVAARRDWYAQPAANLPKRHAECGGYAAKGTSTCVKAPLAKDAIEIAVREGIRESVKAFLEEGGDRLLRRMIKKALSLDPSAERHRKEWEQRLAESDRRIDELMNSLTPVNKEFVDRKLKGIAMERGQLRDRLADLDAHRSRAGDLDALVEEALRSIREFDEVFAEGTLEEQKELLALMVERVDVDPVGRTARAYIRKIPAPSLLGAGNLLQVVAGAGFEPATFGL